MNKSNNFRFYESTNNTFSFNVSKTFSAQLNCWYSSPFKSKFCEYYIRHQLDLALKLDLFKKNLQTSFGVYDIFNKV